MAEEMATQRAAMKVFVINLFVKSPKNQLYFIAQSLLKKAEMHPSYTPLYASEAWIPLYQR